MATHYDCFVDFPHDHCLNPVPGSQDFHLFDIAAHGTMHAATEAEARLIPQ